MAQFPALPLWTDAYIADTEHLSDAEHGRYLRLLILMWRTPGCRIPNDDEWLARRFRRDVMAIKTELRPLIDEFCTVDGNWISQKRLTKEKQFCNTKSEKQSARAKSMWNKKKGVCHAYATSGNAPTPTPIKETIQRKKCDEHHTSNGNGQLLATSSPEFVFEQERPRKANRTETEFDLWWSQYPRKIGKGGARASYIRARKKATVEILLSGIKRYAEECRGKDPQYIAHPATWLNGERWLDQSQSRNGKQSQDWREILR